MVNLPIVRQGEKPRNELEALRKGVIFQLDGYTLLLWIKLYLAAAVASLLESLLELFGLTSGDETFGYQESLIHQAVGLKVHTTEGKAVL